MIWKYYKHLIFLTSQEPCNTDPTIEILQLRQIYHRICSFSNKSCRIIAIWLIFCKFFPTCTWIITLECCLSLVSKISRLHVWTESLIQEIYHRSMLLTLTSIKWLFTDLTVVMFDFREGVSCLKAPYLLLCDIKLKTRLIWLYNVNFFKYYNFSCFFTLYRSNAFLMTGFEHLELEFRRFMKI